MLKPLKPQIKPKKVKFETGDIETWDGLKGTKFRKSAIHTGKQTYFFDTINQMMTWIIRSSRTIYFHNLKFDGRFIIKWLVLNHKKYNLDVGMIYSSGLLGITVRYERGTQTINIKIIDSLRILLVGQAKLEKLFLGKEEKVFVDWDNEVSEKLITERVRTDVESMHKILLKFFDMMHTEFKVWVLGDFTLPSIAVKIFRVNFLHKPLYNPFVEYADNSWKLIANYDLDALCRLGYFGGRVEVFGFPTDFKNENGQYISVYNNDIEQEVDMNSMYPAQLLKPYPTGDYKIIDYETNNKIPTGEGFFIGEIYEKYSYLPILPTRYDKKVVWGYGDKIGSWILPLVRYGIELGLLEIKRGWFLISSSAGTPFKEFGEYMYHNRKIYLSDHKDDCDIDCTKHKNQVMGYIYKIGMNGLIGKLGQQFMRETYGMLIKEDLQQLLDDPTNDKFDNTKVEYRGEYAVMTQLKEVVSDYHMVDKGAYTTGYGQIEWHKTASKFKKLLYGDTDSVHGFDYENIDIGKDLGQWKPEYLKILQAVYITQKIYWVLYEDEDGVYRTVCKAKGFPKELFSFKNGKQKLVPLWEFLYILRKGFEKPLYMSVKEAMKRENKILAWKTFNRKLVVDGSDKREFVTTNGDTIPIEIVPPDGEWKKIEQLINNYQLLLEKKELKTFINLNKS